MKSKQPFEVVPGFLALLAIAAVFSLLVIAGWKIRFAPQPVKISAAEYRAQLEERQATAQARAEWRRLYKKHGYPSTVIYPEGDTPYYMCGKEKKQKCKFI